MALADTAELIVALKLRDQVSGGLSRLNSQLKGMGGGLSQIGTGLGQVGRGVDQIVTRGAIAATAGLTGVITTAASFEQAWAGVQKTVEDANTDLLNDFKQLSREIPLSFEELAGIGAEGGALGIATKDLINFTDIVARLAVSTDLSAEQASSALGQLANVLHLEDADLRDFGDSLVALGNDGASTESQILDLTARFGAAGHQAGLSNEEILALSSTVASMGIEAEAGGGALSRVFNNMTLDIANASDESKVLADAMGLSLGELRTAWDHDAGQVFEDLLGYISQLDQFEAASFLSDLGITNTRDINAITLLASGVDEYQRQLGVAEGQTDELNRESDAFFNTTEGKWELLKNNVRLAADSIGSQLLPVVNDLIEDFTGWLSDPATQRGIESFATNLADGIKDLVREIKDADFGPLIDTMKGAAAVAAGAFDLFRKLPPAVQQLALAAIVANKVSGGAVGSIAKGLTNILAGSIKLLFGRGETPLRPLFVKDVGGGLGGGGGLAGGKGGKGGLGLLGTAGLAGLGLGILTEIGTEIHRALAPTEHTFNELLSQTEGRPGSRLLAEADVRALSEATGQPVEVLEREMIPLLEAGNKTWDEVLAEVRAANTGSRVRSGSFGNNPASAAGSDTVLTREFGGKLDKLATNEVIEHLSRTTEVGLKDVGTSFQTGIKTGMDPVGDIATKILARAEDPKAPAVMTEIQGHLSGLEEIQATYLANGDVKLAQKVQTNIDTLHSLIGTTDQVRAVTATLSAQAASSDAAMLATAQIQSGKLSTLNTTLSSKRFDPKITVQTFPTFKLSTSVIQSRLVQTASLTGTRQTIL